MWVLSTLLALVLHSGSRRRVAGVGAVFLLVTSAMYGLYIAGAYNALSYARLLPWIQSSVALVAIVLGLLQLKDGFGIVGGPSLGLPILWTNLLAENDVALAGAVVLFVVYLSMFLLDELIVFVTVVATMRALKVQEHHSRSLKIVSGMVMITLAAVMLVRPVAMETIGGTLAVFSIATLLSGIGIAAQHVVSGRSGGMRPHRHSPPPRRSLP